MFLAPMEVVSPEISGIKRTAGRVLEEAEILLLQKEKLLLILQSTQFLLFTVVDDFCNFSAHPSAGKEGEEN